MKIKVNSEIGKLKKVLLHRPGKEVERIYPEIFEEILFDDIMYLEQAQKDHDYFAKQLINNDVEVFYIENIVAEIFDLKPELRHEFLKKFIIEGGVSNKNIYNAIFHFFDQEKNNLKFVKMLLAGVEKDEIKLSNHTHTTTTQKNESFGSIFFKEDPYPFYLDPIPNILFQRDPIASIFSGINIHNMTKKNRKREGIFYTYLFKYHPKWQNTIKHLDIDHSGNMEGGDVLVINKKLIFIGISERTTVKSIEQLAINLFKKYHELKNIICIKIPLSHATMHLDTIFTQVDVDKFLVDLDMAEKKHSLYKLNWNNNLIKVESFKDYIINVLKKYVNPNAKIIKVADGNKIAGKAEQWNDGANCLALKPGVVFVYDRNCHTNKALEKNGIKLIKIPSGELSRGRGGPRCMSMPLEREDL